MKLSMKIFALAALMVIASSALAYVLGYRPKLKHHPAHDPFSFKINDEKAALILRLKKMGILATDFTRTNGFNTARCFLLDMKLASGRERFFVYNLQKDSVELAGLVAHGSGSDKGSEELFFSNMPGSNATSLGRYRIGKPYNGKFGLAYKLYGLDDTNSKTFERFVVLHAHPCVPNGEVDPLPICESWGCPTVAPSFLRALTTYVNNSQKPVLLWIYY